MLGSSLCDYIEVYIIVKKTIKITGEEADAAAIQANERNKQVIFKKVRHLLTA